MTDKIRKNIEDIAQSIDFLARVCRGPEAVKSRARGGARKYPQHGGLGTVEEMQGVLQALLVLAYSNVSCSLVSSGPGRPWHLEYKDRGGFAPALLVAEDIIAATRDDDIQREMRAFEMNAHRQLRVAIAALIANPT